MSEVTNNDTANEKKVQKRVTIMDPKSPSSRELYEKMASGNGYQNDQFDMATYNMQDPTTSFSSLVDFSPPPPIINFLSPSKAEDSEKSSFKLDEKDVTERSAYGLPILVWLQMTDDERDEHKRKMRRVNCYRTRLCRAYLQGFCPYGKFCNFAHGQDQLQNPPSLHPKYKTMLCRNFVRGICPYGDRCQFIHKKPKSSNEPLFSYSQDGAQSSSDIYRPFTQSTQNVFNRSMTSPFNRFGMPHSSALTVDQLRSYRPTFESPTLLSVPENSPLHTIDGTPKRHTAPFNSSVPSRNFNMSPRAFAFRQPMQPNNEDNLFGLIQKMAISDPETHSNFMSSIGGSHLEN